MARRWTEDDDIYLEYFAYSGDGGIKDAAEFLKRSPAAVVARLAKLRKHDQSVSCLKRKWSQKEDAFLKKNYKTMPNEQLAQRLGRSIPAIVSRKQTLDLRTIRPISIHREKILELIDQGYYRPEIAKELNINEASLVNFLLINNIHCKDVPYSERTRKMRATWF
jgi:ATP/maltotriose-dependent transcriptional regulator MalT